MTQLLRIREKGSYRRISRTAKKVFTNCSPAPEPEWGKDVDNSEVSKCRQLFSTIVDKPLNALIRNRLKRKTVNTRNERCR